MMKVVFFVLFVVGRLFADFNSLAEEEAYNKEQQQKEVEKKKQYTRQFNEKIVPSIKRLEVFNEQFYQKYLVKNTDTKEMIDEKFKNRVKLFQEMIRDYQASERAYKALIKYADKMHDIDSDGHPVDRINVHRVEYLRKNYFLDSDMNFLDQDLGKGNFSYYEYYLRSAYDTCDKRIQEAKEAKEMEERRKQEEEERVIASAKRSKENEAAQAKMQKEYEARSKEVAAERKKVEPACQKWIASLKNQVNSLGVGDKVVQRGGYATPYTIQAVHANIFVVKYSVGNFYASKLSHNVKKSDCIPYDALRSAPSPYCYK